MGEQRTGRAQQNAPRRWRLRPDAFVADVNGWRVTAFATNTPAGGPHRHPADLGPQPREADGSFGMPRTRSAMMLRWISLVPE